MNSGDVQRLTIGIEEEFQIVDGDGQLKSHGETLIGAARPYLEERVKPEMMQSVVEIGTRICGDVSEARKEIANARGTLATLLKRVARLVGKIANRLGEFIACLFAAHRRKQNTQTDSNA